MLAYIELVLFIEGNDFVLVFAESAQRSELVIVHSLSRCTVIMENAYHAAQSTEQHKLIEHT